MSDVRTIAVCVPQIPFLRGGTEMLAESLCRELNRRSYEAEIVSIPFQWNPHEALERQCLAWRLLDLSESNGRRIDLAIATKFPSYAVQHERKVTWLFHQFRQVYDLFGTPYSDFDSSPEDLAVRDTIRRIDTNALEESRALYAISKTVAERAAVFNDLHATALYPPPRRHKEFREGETRPYILGIGRFDPLKRFGPLVEALRHTDRSLRCVLVGQGPEEARLRDLARETGVEDRIEFRASVSFKELVGLYADCLAVYFAPFQEDYGFVTIEAFLSRKPVVTAPDSGGPLEFVEDGVSGVVVDPKPEELGARLQDLARDPSAAKALGHEGYERVKGIRWEPVIEALVGE